MSEKNPLTFSQISENHPVISSHIPEKNGPIFSARLFPTFSAPSARPPNMSSPASANAPKEPIIASTRAITIAGTALTIPMMISGSASMMAIKRSNPTSTNSPMLLVIASRIPVIRSGIASIIVTIIVGRSSTIPIISARTASIISGNPFMIASHTP